MAMSKVAQARFKIEIFIQILLLCQNRIYQHYAK